MKKEDSDPIPNDYETLKEMLERAGLLCAEEDPKSGAGRIEIRQRGLIQDAVVQCIFDDKGNLINVFARY